MGKVRAVRRIFHVQKKKFFEAKRVLLVDWESKKCENDASG